jgi:hypothetical protein
MIKGTFCPGTHVLSSKLRSTVAGSKMKKAAPLGRGWVVPKAGHSSGSTCADCRFPVMTCVPAKDAGTVVISPPSLAHAGAAGRAATQTADHSSSVAECKCDTAWLCCRDRHCCFSLCCLACALLAKQKPQHTHASIALARLLLAPSSSSLHQHS